MQFTRTQKIVLTGVLTALQIVLTRFAGIQLPYFKLSFSFLPLVIVAVLFGPGYALVSASLADFIAALMYPMPYFPPLTISAALTGLVYGLLLYRKPRSMWRVGLVVFITCIPISLFLSTYWLTLLIGKGYMALLPTRILQQVIMIPVKFVFIWFGIYHTMPRLWKGVLPEPQR